jgi:hypothetical protein
MGKILMTMLAVCITLLSVAQNAENDKLIELGKAYKSFMFRNEPPKGFTKEMQAQVPENLKLTSNFISQTITTDNDLLKRKYLTLPDNNTLKFIYIVRLVNYNLRNENPTDNNKLIDSVKSVDIAKGELVDAYYSMLFASVGNKIKPFDYTKIDFDLKDYNLSDDMEKGIFFLECIDYCGKEIWGYINIVKPANTSKAYDAIRKFPKFNGVPYFQFQEFNYPDFEMVIVKGKGKQSYKSYYLDKYYEVLLSHLLCLRKENAPEKDINDLLLGSILKDSAFYKYSKNKAILEKLFKEVK